MFNPLLPENKQGLNHRIFNTSNRVTPAALLFTEAAAGTPDHLDVAEMGRVVLALWDKFW
jgi:hypothetical protein